eukprot:3449251-Amphidinium_carterae.1
MHFDVNHWPQLASDLWECGMVRWVPTSWVPRVRGAIKRAGLFGVPKASGDRLRLIIDRRPANWAEHKLHNLRELLLDDVVQEKVDFSEFKQLWRLMSLPHASILQDIFLGRKGYLQVTAEDCSDYFYMLRLPPHQHYHTALGWSLDRTEIAEEQLRADLAGADIEAAASFTPLLRVVPMGDRKSMELAQAVHQHIHLRAGSLESSTQLTHGWLLPGRCSIWGSYCDDLALVDLLHRHLRGEHCKKLVKQASADRLVRVKERYGQVGLELKEQKEQLRAQEATVWGASLSSSRREVRGDLKKTQALVMLTRVVQSPRITTHALQKTIGFWIHHCMYQRASLCLFQESYRWIEEGKRQPHVPRVLPALVRQEFQGAILLYPLIRSDLASCLNSDLYASDATQEVGAVIKARVSLSDMVLAWSRRTHHLSPGHAVLEESQLYKLDREERKDRLWEQLVARQCFSLVAKYHFASSAHINVKELMAAMAAEGLRSATWLRTPRSGRPAR